MTVLGWVGFGLFAVAVAGVTLWSVRRTRQAMQAWFRRAVLRTIHDLHLSLERYKLVSRRTINDELLRDPVVLEAIGAHATEHGLSEMEVRVRVETYINEIVPHFNVLTYYRLGYNLARVLVHLLYRVSARQRDPKGLAAIPDRDVIVYLMNHRSNADYVIVAYVLGRQVSISYAVGEWARVWPLEYVFKSFGAYFVRRRHRERLYHTVLERYVQLVTRNGVTQGIFLEGGLSRNGALRPAKIGLLDYIARTMTDPTFTQNIWLVPVAINYDRVLEDRTLIHELLDARARPGRLTQLVGVTRYVGGNLARLIAGRLRRYGRAAVEFGSPLSLDHWLAARPGILERPRPERLAALQQLADDVLDRIARIMPVPPVPLVAAALLSFDETIVAVPDVLTRIAEFRVNLHQRGARPIQQDLEPEAMLQRAERTLHMRRLVVREGERFVLLPSQRPLLEFYANSIRHLLPQSERPIMMHPARDSDADLPRLKEWKPQ